MTPEFRTSRKARLAGVALLLVTFVTGALTGAAVSRVLAREAIPETERREEGRRERRPSTEDFLSRLDLTAEQDARIDSILSLRRGQIHGIWKEMRPRMRALGDSARVEIASVLTDEQRAAYEAFLAEQRARHHGRRSRSTDDGDKDDEGR